MKKIYIVRHCEAKGQSADATLTDKGYKQATDLCKFFCDIEINHIITSPFVRAIESVQPLANHLNLQIVTDNNLKERVLSSDNFNDWLEKLEATFNNHELKFEGGESSAEAGNRIITVVEGIFNSNDQNTVIVTHGNLMSLLLRHFNESFGFKEWRSLSNPDVYLLENRDNKVTFKRLWRGPSCL